MASTKQESKNILAELGDQRSAFRKAIDLVRGHGLGATGAIIILSMMIMAALAAYLAPHDPELNNFASMHVAPNATYWLGTDQFGRDLLSRLIFGAQTALFVGFVAAFSGATTGLVLGVTVLILEERSTLFFSVS